jgi:selenocysteine lyase/cysteine desulfurase
MIAFVAMEFRKSLGGEDVIMQYCHDLAIKGGAIAAKILGTNVMENTDQSLTVAMVNVEIPLRNINISDAEVISIFIDKLLYEHNCMAPVYKHNNIWYTRLSAQVYTDETDFETVAKAILAVCKELEIK